MNTHVRRSAMLFAATIVALTMGLQAAQAANHRASCVGLIVSTEASAGVLEVETYKALAEGGGFSTFGEFVKGGAQIHLGSPEACFPQ